MSTFPRTCEHCGRTFVARREHARFCSDYCRVTWHRKHTPTPSRPKRPEREAA